VGVVPGIVAHARVHWTFGGLFVVTATLGKFLGLVLPQGILVLFHYRGRIRYNTPFTTYQDWAENAPNTQLMIVCGLPPLTHTQTHRGRID
jgi:hypothetical protein